MASVFLKGSPDYFDKNHTWRNIVFEAKNKHYSFSFSYMSNFVKTGMGMFHEILGSLDNFRVSFNYYPEFFLPRGIRVIISIFQIRQVSL